MKTNRFNFEFRAGTCDANVFRDVVELNEYRLPDALPADEWIVDVGAHIGSFTQACLERGARKLVAFEPDPENYTRARRHLAGPIAAGDVILLPAALTGRERGVGLLANYPATAEEVNTGGCSLVGLRGRFDRFIVQLPWPDLWADLRDRIHLLKLDCEGSEWEILRVLRPFPPRNICGEYHPVAGQTVDYLRQLLAAADYQDLTIEPHGDSGLGLFWGKQNQG